LVQSPRSTTPLKDNKLEATRLPTDSIAQRGRILDTVIAEETTYYNDVLSTLIELYEEPLRHSLSTKRPILSSKQINDIFGNLRDLHALSAELLQRLRHRQSEPWNMGSTFLELAPFFKAYTTYVVGCSSAVELVNQSLENAAFLDFWRAAGKLPASKGQMLQSLLVVPLQRIPRYRQQLESLSEITPSDSPEYADLQESITAFKRISEHITESRREHEATLRLVNLSKMLIVAPDMTSPIHEGVRLIKQGLVMKRSRAGFQARALFLLSDRLLITSPTFPVDLPIPNLPEEDDDADSLISDQGPDLLADAGIGNYILRDNLAVELVRASHDVVGEDAFDVGFQTQTPEKSFDAYCQTTGMRNDWVNAINGAAKDRLDVVTDTQDESIRRRLELASFQAPVWIPDEDSPRCFICDKAFSTFVRRHHCRSCGRVVCFECGSKSVELPGIKANRWERVCDICYEHRGGRLNFQSRASSFDDSRSASVDKSVSSKLTSSPKRHDHSGSTTKNASPMKDANACQLCRRAFGWFVWKYQCQTCGKQVDFACFQTDKGQCEPCSKGLDPQFIQVTTNGWSYMPE